LLGLHFPARRAFEDMDHSLCATRMPPLPRAQTFVCTPPWARCPHGMSAPSPKHILPPSFRSWSNPHSNNIMNRGWCVIHIQTTLCGGSGFDSPCPNCRRMVISSFVRFAHSLFILGVKADALHGMYSYLYFLCFFVKSTPIMVFAIFHRTPPKQCTSS
jgi:hypothetical protein